MTPDYCPIGYQYSISSDLQDIYPQAITFNEEFREFTFSTNELGIEGTYTVTVTAFSITGKDSGASFSFDVTFVDPCKDAILMIDPAIFGDNQIQYELGT